MSNEYTATPL